MQRAIFVVLGLAGLGAGCTAGNSRDRIPTGPALSCSIPSELILDGGPGKDGIPALVNPSLVDANDPQNDYLLGTDRVMGVVVEGQAIAVPLNIQWWHEIVNLRVAGRALAVTHCPLTGSSLTFDRGTIEEAAFGVSGLLFLNNLIMYDRTSSESWWPQLARGARCGPRTGAALTMYPTLEITWDGWKSLHPQTQIVSAETGHDRDYQLYPYGDYDLPWNRALLSPIPGGIDDRRPPKERVLGIPAGDSGGVALPFGILDALGTAVAVHVQAGGQDFVVFWDRSGEAAAAYVPFVEGDTLSFRVTEDRIVDDQTESTWRVDGLALSGSLAGTRLEPVADAFVAYWFAWAAFYPQAELWLGS